MPTKKGKKKKTGKDAVKEAKNEEKKEEEAPNEYAYVEQKPGWIYLQLNLCHVPFSDNARNFNVFMLSSQRIAMVRNKIIEHHGRIEDIEIYDSEPPE